MHWLVGQGCTQVVTVSWMHGGPDSSRPLFEKMGFAGRGVAEELYLEDSLARGLHCPYCNGACHCSGMLFIRAAPAMVDLVPAPG